MRIDLFIRFFGVASLLFFAACASPEPTVALVPEPEVAKDISFAAEQADLGAVVRALQGTTGRGVVLMNGLETVKVGPYDFEHVTDADLLRRLARDAASEVVDMGRYYFVRPGTHATLDRLQLPRGREAALDRARASIALGSGTPLFDAFALLSHGTRTTIVADNAVAAAHTGELFVGPATLRETVEAILRSARLQEGSFAADITEEYILIRSAGNRHADTLLLNAAGLTSDELATLERRVDLRLPMPPANAENFETDASAQPLVSALGPIAEQLGVPVSADDALKPFPVNPVVMNGVRVRTAVELIIRQWLRPEFGYEFVDGGIRFRRIRSE